MKYLISSLLVLVLGFVSLAIAASLPATVRSVPVASLPSPPGSIRVVTVTKASPGIRTVSARDQMNPPYTPVAVPADPQEDTEHRPRSDDTSF